MTDTSYVEGEEYYYDPSGLVVFTEKYLLKRGTCCENDCRHCPYGFNKKKADSTGSSSDIKGQK